MSIISPQRWCGQSQPHDQHLWADPSSSLYQSCAGHSGTPAPGPCWSEPSVPGGRSSYRCELLAGHHGAHECSRGSLGGTAVWTDAETHSPDPAADPTKEGEA